MSKSNTLMDFFGDSDECVICGTTENLVKLSSSVMCDECWAKAKKDAAKDSEASRNETSILTEWEARGSKSGQ